MSTRHLITDGFWVTLRQGMMLGISFGLSIIFARFVDKEVFGQYQLFLSIITVISIVSLPGLNTSLVQSVARGFEGNYQKSVRLSFYYSLLAVPLFLCGGVIGLSIHHDLGFPLLAAAFLFPFVYAFNTWDSFLQGKKRFDISSRYGMIQSLSLAFLLFLAAYFEGRSLLIIVLTYMIGNASLNWYSYRSSRRYIENSKEEPSDIRYGFFLTKINFLSLLAENADKLVVGLLLGPEDLAVYALGISVAKIIFDFSKTTVSIFVPRISVTGGFGLRTYLAIFFALVPVTICAYLLLPVIMPLLFSERYVTSVALSQAAILFLPFIFVNLFYLSHFLYVVKEKKIIAWYTGLLAVAKIVVMVPLLLWFGVTGLAFAFGFQSILSLALLLVLGARFRALRYEPVESVGRLL